MRTLIPDVKLVGWTMLNQGRKVNATLLVCSGWFRKCKEISVITLNGIDWYDYKTGFKINGYVADYLRKTYVKKLIQQHGKR